AQQFGATHLVSVSGDCPLIHPPFIQRGIATILQKNADHLYSDKSKYDCLHEGLGFFTTASWQRLDQLSQTWFHKEHPGSVLADDMVRFEGVEIVPETAFQRQDFRMSVDTLADLEFMNYVYSELENGEIVDLYDVVNLVDEKPHIKLLNAHVHQKSLTERNSTIAIITHAGKEVGLGHLARCMALARELKESQSQQVVFCINEDEIAINMLRESGFVFTTWNLQQNQDEITETLFSPDAVSGIVLDVKGDKGIWLDHWLNILQTIDLPKFMIDHVCAEKSTTSIIPTVLQGDGQNDSALQQKNVVSGKDYLLLNRKITFWRQNKEVEKSGILVAAGGSGTCPGSLMRALYQVSEWHRIKFLVGPFADRSALESQLQDLCFSNYDIIFNPPDPYKVYCESELALSTFGVTAYELIALGIPTVVVQTLHDGDRNVVRYMAENQVCIDALDRVSTPSALAKQILGFMQNPGQRNQLSERAKAWIDGRGAERVAKVIKSSLTRDHVYKPAILPSQRPETFGPSS
ncbi:MAG: hypothetical protein ACE5I1_16665, partial [bacterium]